MREHRLIVVLGILMLTNSAQAAWTALSSGGAALLDVSQPTDTDLFAIGLSVDQTGYIPKPVVHVYASTNGGVQLTEITNGFSGIVNIAPVAVQFVDAQVGYVVAGQRVFATSNRGQSWISTDLGVAVNGLAFINAEEGIVVGKGGIIKRRLAGGSFQQIPSPTTVDLMKVVFVNAQRGYIGAYNMVESQDPYDNSVTKSYVSAQLLRTNDGGYSWEAGQVFGDYAIEEIFFLPDGLHGYISAYKWLDADRNEAHLFKTSDGGVTMVDMNVPLQVGTIQMGTSGPINVDRFLAIYWTSEGYGRLGGTAFIAKASSSEGNPPKAYRNVEFFTADNGATWSKTDLGTITLSMDGSSSVQNDWGQWGGMMRSLYDGRLVGENRTVYGFSQPCNGAGSCVTGYVCNATSQCVPETTAETCVPACSDGSHCVNQECVPLGGDSDTVDPTGGDSDTPSSFKFGQGGNSGGCKALPGASWTWILVLLGLAGEWRRR